MLLITTTYRGSINQQGHYKGTELPLRQTIGRKASQTRVQLAATSSILIHKKRARIHVKGTLRTTIPMASMVRIRPEKDTIPTFSPNELVNNAVLLRSLLLKINDRPNHVEVGKRRIIQAQNPPRDGLGLLRVLVQFIGVLLKASLLRLVGQICDLLVLFCCDMLMGLFCCRVQ